MDLYVCVNVSQAAQLNEVAYGELQYLKSDYSCTYVYVHINM